MLRIRAARRRALSFDHAYRRRRRHSGGRRVQDHRPPQHRFSFTWGWALSGHGDTLVIGDPASDLGGKTELTLTHEGLPTADDREGHGKGWNSTLNKLALYVKGEPQMTHDDRKPINLELTRHFDAPPERVFDAWLQKSWGEWAGPPGVKGEVTLLEPRVGGRYRIVMHVPDGSTLTVGGIYQGNRPSRRAS